MGLWSNGGQKITSNDLESWHIFGRDERGRKKAFISRWGLRAWFFLHNRVDNVPSREKYFLCARKLPRFQRPWCLVTVFHIHFCSFFLTIFCSKRIKEQCYLSRVKKIQITALFMKLIVSLSFELCLGLSQHKSEWQAFILTREFYPTRAGWSRRLANLRKAWLEIRD